MAQLSYTDIATGSPRDIVPINQRFAAIKTQLNGNLDVTNLANDAVEEAKIKDLAVTTGKLADDAVTAAKLADDAVATASVVDAAITTAKVADDAITYAKVARDEVTPTLSFSGSPSSQTVECVRIGDTVTINAKVSYGGAGQTIASTTTLITLPSLQVTVDNMYFMATARTNGGSFTTTPCYVSNSGADIVIKKYADLASVVEFDISLTIILA